MGYGDFIERKIVDLFQFDRLENETAWAEKQFSICVRDCDQNAETFEDCDYRPAPTVPTNFSFSLLTSSSSSSSSSNQHYYKGTLCPHYGTGLFDSVNTKPWGIFY